MESLNMNSSPYFSILLPTKNRAHIVGYAIQSILNQSFQDFEIILVDNDDGDATEKSIKGFSDPRLKYFRTGSLNMCENWEFALEQAQGKYITVLEDKQAYYPDALDMIHKAIIETSSEVIVWGWDVFNDQIKTAYQTSDNKGIDNVTSKYILQFYTTQPHNSWGLLPRMLNSCISHDLIKKIKSFPFIDKFFAEISPDLCASFYTLANIDQLCFIREPLGLVGYFHLSNAKKIIDDPGNELTYFGKGITSSKMIDRVPIKEHKLIHNSVYNDFLRVREKFRKQLQDYQMTPEVYARLCLTDLARIPYKKGNLKIFKSIFTYMKKNNVSTGLLFLFFLKTLCVRKLGEFSWLRKLRDKLKSKTWKAENILDASLRDNR